ncbi:tRNA (N6-isopentenyl adenosine(37)-C2)-methylthiotransferase MiaB [Candidatus Rhabdochlamydia porcellionis]|jgi:tRNA-2-methylthio-N6-dimethylallyladenosine synthase|uniref:tRNA-2-methylthio-N(6)-dimethylallyladenosine synthase n=1 Tax=Candidatus Rhabdochlamydia porcellionis TaxID=225148 RepID=A0ABX8Z050_9BACT|nr:tRNA (N6-isopentenyl adenosine(37)-C2)-methylthiotransferase MiaB [Candidatus Rhabdochlamydia porcellionis]QZA58992.1 tRNA-2-methylthio-N(6)-dimethylallyladenosine synthase [Candidatus Rhabdochlamydia porcellionis]
MRKQQVKTFFVKTYGCQMNELDTEIMVGLLEKRGLKRVLEEDRADLFIANTCSIRDLSERKAFGKIGRMGKNFLERPVIGITGCMAMAKKDSLFRKLPHVDFVLGTNNINDLNEVLDEVLLTGKKTIRTVDQFEENLDYLTAKRDDPIKAFISIIRGCDKFCTYCVVPYTRGQEVSRHPDQIIEECKLLVEKGYKEITLLGQNVNSYGKDKAEWGYLFHDLLYRLDQIQGLQRIRFMTSHPVDITVELMQAIRDLPSVCEFVHFPIQAGSNRILKKMHRIYTLETYLEKVALLKKIVPNVSLGTDIIVGFPTETEQEFQQTYDILKKIRYSVAFIFSYSARKGTPAFRWKDDIPEEVKQERLQRLLQLHEQICAEQRQELLGSYMEVLVEKPTKDKCLKGRSRCWKSVVFTGNASLVGSLQTVKITGFSNQTLLGELSSSFKCF